MSKGLDNAIDGGNDSNIEDTPTISDGNCRWSAQGAISVVRIPAALRLFLDSLRDEERFLSRVILRSTCTTQLRAFGAILLSSLESTVSDSANFY